jgi:hypothetical protein
LAVVKIGPLAALADGQVDHPGGPRRERDDGFLAAPAGDRQGAVPALGPQRFDVRAGGLEPSIPLSMTAQTIPSPAAA